MANPDYFRVIDSIRQRVVVSAARSSVVPGNRPGIFAGLVQERAAPLPAGGEDRSAQNVSPRAGARRLVRHRADAGDAAGARLTVPAGDSRRAGVSAKWRAAHADRDVGEQRPGLYFPGLPGARRRQPAGGRQHAGGCGPGSGHPGEHRAGAHRRRQMARGAGGADA